MNSVPLYKTKDRDIIAARSADVSLDLSRHKIENGMVKVRQNKHGFLFGSNAFPAIPLSNGMPAGEARERAQKTTDLMLEICNFVTLPFYWAGF